MGFAESLAHTESALGECDMVQLGFFKILKFLNEGKDAQGYQTRALVESCMATEWQCVLFLPPHMRKVATSIDVETFLKWGGRNNMHCHSDTMRLSTRTLVWYPCESFPSSRNLRILKKPS